jgi:hypothetical protein
MLVEYHERPGIRGDRDSLGRQMEPDDPPIYEIEDVKLGFAPDRLRYDEDILEQCRLAVEGDV